MKDRSLASALHGYNNKEICLLGILALALGLRVWGIWFGLPNLYSTDEWFEVKRALKLGAGSYEFDRAGKGLFFYVLFVEYGFYYVLGRLLGHFQSGYDFLLALFNDPTKFWLIGRTTNAVIGSLNCYFLYLLGRRIHSRNVGLIASLLMAVHILHVVTSHHIGVDIPLVFLITVSLLIMYSRSATLNFGIAHYSILAVVCALAVTAKITGGVIIFSVLAFHYANLKLEERTVAPTAFIVNRRLAILAAVFIVVLFAAEPGYLVNIKQKGVWVLSFFGLVDSGRESMLKWPISARTPWIYYLQILFPWKYLAFSSSVLIGGILSFTILRREIFFAFVIPYFFFLFASVSKELIFARYLLPVLPILFIYSGLALERVWGICQRHVKHGRVVFLSVLTITLYPLIMDSITYDLSLTNPDTRTIAKSWVKEHIPVKSRIYIEGTGITPSASTVPLRMDPNFIDKSVRNASGDPVKDVYYRAMKESLKSGPTYRLILINNTGQLSEALQNRIGDYVILNGAIEGRFSLEINQKYFPEIYQLLLWVESGEFGLIKIFEPDKETVGPKILIYKRRD